MGNLITADPALAGSPFDKWKLFRATSSAGPFTLINTQDLTDLTFYDTTGSSSSFYRYSYFDSVNTVESALSAVITFTRHYTTVENVRSLLQLSTISDTTNPNIQDVQNLISRKEDEIDYRTGHAWRRRFSGTASGMDTTAKFEFYDVTFAYEYQTGIPIYLQHRQVKPLDAAKGDAFDIWNGSEYESWLDKVEDRDGDWHGDFPRGMIYVRARWGVRGPIKARLKYRWGEEFVPGDVEDICTKMVCIDLLSGMDSRALVLQEGSIAFSHRERVEFWRKDIEHKLLSRKEFGIPAIHQTGAI